MHNTWKVAWFVVLICIPSTSFAGIIFESATLGQTGLTLLDMSNQSIPGSNVRGLVFQGVRFQFDSPVLTTRVGGHFIASEGGGSFFGAIVSLSDEFDFPDSAELSTSDVIGVAEMTFPDNSEEVFGDLNLVLHPGWYALVFGSELFSTQGKGVAVGNGSDLSTPSYFGWQPSAPNLGWIDFFGGSINQRFVVEGTIIREPSTLAILSSGLFMLLYLPLHWRR